MKKLLLVLIALSLLFSCEEKNKEKKVSVNEEKIVLTPELKKEAKPEIKPKKVVETIPEKKQEEPKVQKKEKTIPKPEEEIVATFGKVKITKKDYVDTKSEIVSVVEDLNTITANSDYKRWRTYLSDEYVEYFSQKNVLQAVSEKLPIKGIRLNSLNDYFNYVFVPSRKAIRVDDIKFTSPKTVDVIMHNAGSRLLIYSLEKREEQWKLVRSR